MPGADARRWYRSLYWRIALGLVATIAAILGVQGLVVLWLLGREGPAPGPPPPGFARLVAQDLGRELEATPGLDLGRFVREEYQQRLFPFVVVLRDGRVVSPDGATVPDELRDAARLLMERAAEAPRFPGRRSQAGREEIRERGGRGGRGGRGLIREELLLGGAPPAVIRVNGEPVGVVFVMPQTLLRRFGPTLLLTGIAAVVAGTVLMAASIFGPVRRRLADIERTAEAIGQGRLDARAREDGGDEVADLARSFNLMAGDLAARQREVEGADRARRLLLADVSHELMTPLTSMRGYLETLAMPAVAADSDTRERYLRIVGDETRRLEHIVGDLLDLARLEAGGSQLDIQDVSVEGLFGAVTARHQLDAAARGVTLTATIEPGAEIVRGDERRLEQALQNLVANALRHTPAGGEVRMDCRLEGSTMVIAIRDTGGGIDPQHLPYLFDRFYKVDASRGGLETGSGLGLSIVKAVVDRHQGAVAVASSPAGSTFELRLPAGEG
jgi:signal transduction histidine kinase